MFVEDRISNIDHSFHFVAFLLFVPPFLNGGQMRTQIARYLSFVSFAPGLYGARTSFLSLVGQDDVTCGSMHEIHHGASLNVKARTHGGIHLRDYHDLSPVEHAQMTRLTEFVSNLLHDRQRLHSHAFDRRVFLREPKQVQGEVVTFTFRAPRNVATFFEA